MMTVNDVIAKLMDMDPSTPVVISSSVGDYFYRVNSIERHENDDGRRFCLIVAEAVEFDL